METISMAKAVGMIFQWFDLNIFYFHKEEIWLDEEKSYVCPFPKQYIQQNTNKIRLTMIRKWVRILSFF